MSGDERVVLDHWLDLYRDTVLLKLAGLDADQLARRSVPPSTLSLIGVVRHLTEVEAYRAELTTTRANAAGWTDLDIPTCGLRENKAVNLRWILVHLIEEYARHLGHMDLLREAVDGRTGY